VQGVTEDKGDEEQGSNGEHLSCVFNCPALTIDDND
jgi:hypothetical protein